MIDVDLLRTTKAQLLQCDIKIYMKDVKSIKTVKRDYVGHVYRVPKKTIRVEMRNGDVYIYTSEPTGVYSAKCTYKLIESILTED